jgi:hypothetical protein
MDFEFKIYFQATTFSLLPFTDLSLNKFIIFNKLYFFAKFWNI